MGLKKGMTNNPFGREKGSKNKRTIEVNEFFDLHKKEVLELALKRAQDEFIVQELNNELSIWEDVFSCNDKKEVLHKVKTLIKENPDKSYRWTQNKGSDVILSKILDKIAPSLAHNKNEEIKTFEDFLLDRRKKLQEKSSVNENNN